MFTVYVDDSGSDPNQTTAIAGVLVVPARQILSLESTWASFASKYGFKDLHASECVARNPKSYAGWDETKVQKVFSRARQIIKKHTSKAFSFTINKKDFDAEAPPEWREVGGENHYTWAWRSLLNLLVRWHSERNIDAPFEFVFDWAEKRDKVEIEMVMAQFDSLFPNQFEGHYTFRRRKDVPGLQCADLLAWTCFGMSRLKFHEVPMHEVAEESFSDFSNYQDRQWLDALTFERDALHAAITLDRADTEGERMRREWHRNYAANLHSRGRTAHTRPQSP
ncbi:MAG TPA: DUF3800 domain-containing protein [Terracidiphilus sp.]|nr:DUF3800 domain-containing protein [Terracidiphilus sp.]